jgi:hypothetical protein
MGRLVITVLIAGMMSAAGCSQNLKFEKYSSNDPDVGVTLEHLFGWKVSEQRGSFGSFSQIVFSE